MMQHQVKHDITSSRSGSKHIHRLLRECLWLVMRQISSSFFLTTMQTVIRVCINALTFAAGFPTGIHCLPLISLLLCGRF
jgi:hypothetical protein